MRPFTFTFICHPGKTHNQRGEAAALRSLRSASADVAKICHAIAAPVLGPSEFERCVERDDDVMRREALEVGGAPHA